MGNACPVKLSTFPGGDFPSPKGGKNTSPGGELVLSISPTISFTFSASNHDVQTPYARKLSQKTHDVHISQRLSLRKGVGMEESRR